MMFPKDGKYVCNSCGAIKEIGGKAEVIKTDAKEKETTVFGRMSPLSRRPVSPVQNADIPKHSSLSGRRVQLMNLRRGSTAAASATTHGESTEAVQMFKAELKSDTLKGLVNIISTLIDEVKFTIKPEGMTLKAVDAAHVAMIEMEITKNAFESYSAEDTELGLDLDKVKGVLKLAGAGETIMMEQDDSTGKLVFKVGNITRRMSLIDTTGMTDPKVPQLNLTATINVPIEELQKGIRAVESISDHITLKAGPEFFELSCEGDTDSVSLKLDNTAAKISTDSDVCSMFPPEYLANIIKAIPGGTQVDIELDNDYPVKLVFSLADGAARVNYLLAPRIESE